MERGGSRVPAIGQGQRVLGDEGQPRRLGGAREHLAVPLGRVARAVGVEAQGQHFNDEKPHQAGPIHLKTKDAFHGENVFAWPSVAPFVGLASAGVPLIRLSKVDYVLVMRMRS